MKIIKNLKEQSVSGHKTLLPLLMTFSFKMNCLFMLHDETKNSTKTKKKKSRSTAINSPQNGCLARGRGTGAQFAPPQLSSRHTARPQQARAGHSAARVFAQGGSSSAFDFGLHLRCPTSSSWPSAWHLPSTIRPGRRMPAGAARAGLPRLTAPLENKSRANQVHFRLFYRSHHPA